jgi:hypothetical protein
MKIAKKLGPMLPPGGRNWQLIFFFLELSIVNGSTLHFSLA